MPEPINKILYSLNSTESPKHLFTVRFLLFTLSSLCSSALTALAGTQWDTSDTQTKVMIVIGVLGSWSTTVGAYLDKTAQKLSTGESPFGTTPPNP